MKELHYRDFVNYYQIDNLRTTNRYFYVDPYNAVSAYQSDRDERVEMSIPRRAFDHLVETERKWSADRDAQRQEEVIRQKNPSVMDAYNKYKMLLELAR